VKKKKLSRKELYIIFQQERIIAESGLKNR